MSSVNFKNNDQTKGFSLVELMVGMTLGLFTVIIITQVFSVFENQKRTTTAGSDAQENGLMATVQLEQDIRNAGAGFTNSAAFDCQTIYSQYNGVVPAPGVPATGGAAMAPVVITDGGTNGSDTITMARGTDFLGSIPTTLTSTMPHPSSILNVNRTLGFVDGKIILVLQDNHCTVMQVSNVNDSALNLQHNPGNDCPGPDGCAYNPSSSFYNSPPGDSWPAYTAGAIILDLGSFVVNTYSIDANHSLQLTSNVTGAAASTATLVKDIVSLQAQYGISSAVGVQNVTSWVDATAATGFNTLDTAKVKRIKAIRITVVARSGKKEAGTVTAIAPVAEVNNTSLPDWQQYRYRTYTTIIPLRNIIWANL